MWLTGAEERPGLAKVGRGAWGARGDGGPRSAMGPAPRSAGTNPAERHPRGRILVEAGGAPRRPLAAEPDRDGPPEGFWGGGRGWAPGLWGPGPGSSRAGAGETGRALGLQLVRGGRERAGLARGRTPRGPRGLSEGSRGRPFPGGGGGCSLPGGRRGPLLCEGGGRACIARCSAMSIHGRAAWDYIPNPPRRSPFLGGLRGGGGAGGCRVHPPMKGGVAGGSSVRLGRKYPVASPGPVGPFEEEPRIRRGGLRLSGMASVVWPQWYGLSGRALVVWSQ